VQVLARLQEAGNAAAQSAAALAEMDCLDKHRIGVRLLPLLCTKTTDGAKFA